tara:strand:+ start:1614 stop:1877 length:264 start_codon:yes stop_codon:yes gene_type:complete
MHKVVNGIKVPLTEEEIIEFKKREEEHKKRLKLEKKLSYREKRKAEYPDIGEQLDALYHAMDQGILPKVDGFYDKIKAVKEKYPKGG